MFFTTLLCVGCNDKNPKGEGDDDDDLPNQEIVDYFSGYLSGRQGLYEDSLDAIALSALAAERELVWEAWVNANNKRSEDKLINLDALSAGKSGTWAVPANLEPNAVTNYWWGTKGAKPASGYPLLMYLHGSGDKNSEWTGARPMVLNFNDAPAVYFIPQVANVGNYQPWYLKAKQYTFERMLRLAFVTGEIDADKVYFYGISEGGYGSQRIGAFYADYMAGVGPMAGGEPLKNAPVENYRNTAFNFRTGANDTGFHRNILTQYTKDEFERFQAEFPESFVHHIELIPGAGHGIDYTQTTPWLKQHTRNPYPKYVTWENFEMDGQYRKGFYNIFVNERSNTNTDSRGYYELKIDGNNLALTVETVTYTTTEVDQTWGIHMKFAKSYQPATKGKVTIYLSPELVDLTQDVTLTVNGVEAYNGKVSPERRHLVNSCAAFFDPARLYPAAIEVDLQNL